MSTEKPRDEQNSTDQTDLLRLKILSHKVQEHRLEKVWERFAKAGFKPLLIKGWAAAQFYPEPSDRRYDDIDLIIEPDRYLEAVEFLKSFSENTAVDLHRGARHLDSLSYENLFVNSKTIKCGTTEIRVPRPEDHLRILCVHWLTDGGENKQRLWDIYYAVANRSEDFDWDRCLNVVSETRRKWIVCTIGLAHRYFQLDVRNTPLADERLGDIPGWIIETVEKEWKSAEKLLPLRWCFNDKAKLFRQIKKRIPPNPIQATIDMEGEFDDKQRIFYQVGDIFYRLTPSLKRLVKELFNLPK